MTVAIVLVEAGLPTITRVFEDALDAFQAVLQLEDECGPLAQIDEESLTPDQIEMFANQLNNGQDIQFLLGDDSISICHFPSETP